MKLITRILLEEFGFSEKESAYVDRVIMTRGGIDLVLKKDGECYYSNMGFEYPVKDLGALKKLYKELRREELAKN